MKQPDNSTSASSDPPPRSVIPAEHRTCTNEEILAALERGRRDAETIRQQHFLIRPPESVRCP